MLSRLPSPPSRKHVLHRNAEARAAAREPSPNRPFCSSCRFVDQIPNSAQLMCWRHVDAVDGAPIECSTARSMDGSCGPVGANHEAGAPLAPAMSNARTCVSCGFHNLDVAIGNSLLDIHECRRFVRADRTSPQCSAVRGMAGACGPEGASWKPASDAPTAPDPFADLAKLEKM